MNIPHDTPWSINAITRAEAALLANRKPSTSCTRFPSTLTGTQVNVQFQVLSPFGALIRILFHPAWSATGVGGR